MIGSRMLILMLIAAAVWVASVGVGVAATLTVDDSGGADYTIIQDAVYAANAGDTVFVYSGIYHESINVYSDINLIGENKNNTVIDGNGNEVISIYSDNVEVSTFTLQNGDGGITARNSADGKIFNNIIRFNTGGIGLEISNNFMIFDNYVYNNSQAGIGIWDGSYDSNIYNNTIIQNGYEGIGVGETSYNITIFNNYVYNNTNTGIGLWDGSYDSNIYNNTIIQNGYEGIGVGETSYNITIFNNYVYNNTNTGIGLWDTSNHVVLYNNTLINNSNANIAIGGLSFSNVIYHNNFISDFTNALDYNDTDSWDNGYPSGGNYWSDYTGIDFNSDGIGDTPYIISGGAGAQDKYPLMQPWNRSSSVTTPSVHISSSQDFMERRYIANGSFSSSPSDMTYRMRLEIDADSGQFTVPKVVIFNTSSVNLDRIYYQVDGVSLGRGNIVVFPDRIEWTGNNETVSSEFELGIYELNTHQLTPPFSSSRSVEKEVFDGDGTVKMIFNATPTDNLDYLEITVFAEETDHADSILLEETATNEGFIDESSTEKIRWEFDDPVIGHTYSASVNMTVTPKTDSATRYWAYTRIEGGYGSYTNSTSGSNQSMVEYMDSILGDVRIYFESPVDYCSTDADGEEYYERFKHFSETVEDGEPHTIGIGDNAYEPCVRTVPSGTTVSWTNWEELVHTVTSDTGLWDSGNLSDSQSFSHTFDTPGTYTYHDALHLSVTGVVIVQDQAPCASFTYSPENPIVDQTMTFNASFSYDPDGNITSYPWDFGDGNTGTGELVTHSYAAAGSYNVTLTVTDDDGATDSTSQNIEVTNATQCGKIVYTSDESGNYDIWIMDDDGSSKIQLTNTSENECSPFWSPDGTKIAYVLWARDNPETPFDVYMMSSSGNDKIKLVEGAYAVVGWLNNEELLFIKGWTCVKHVYAAKIDGSGVRKLFDPAELIPGKREGWALDVSPDGKKIVFESQDGCWVPTMDIFVVDADGKSNIKTLYADSNYIDRIPRWSLDGSKIIWMHGKDSGHGVPEAFNIWVMNHDGSDAHMLCDLSYLIGSGEGWNLGGSTPTGKIVFSVKTSGSSDLWIISPEGYEASKLTDTPSINEKDPDVISSPLNQPPTVSFTYLSQNPLVNEEITFDASASYDPDGNITSYQWNFGDGTDGTGVVVTHSYSIANNYTVNLTVTDDAGLTNLTSKKVLVVNPPEDHATLSISYTLSNLSSVNWTELSSEYNASIGTNYARFEITHMLPDLVNIRCAKPGSKYFAIIDENTATYTIRVEGNSSELLRAVLPRYSSYIYTDDCLDGSCTKWGFEIGKTKSNMLNLTAFSTIENLKDIGILSSGDLTGMPVFRTSLINPGEKIFLFGYGMSGSGASPSTPTDSWSWNIPSPASYGDYTNSFGFVTDNMRYQYLLGHVGGDNSNNGVITINSSEWLRHNNWYDSDRHGKYNYSNLSGSLIIHWTWSSVWTSLWQASIGSSFNVTEVPYGNYYNSSITPVRDEILKITVVDQSVLPIRSEIIDDSTLPDMSHSDITGGNILNNTYTAPPGEHFYKLYLRPWSSSGKGVAVRVDGLRSDNQKWEIIENYVTQGDFIIDDYDFFESDQKTYDQIKIYVDESESWGTAHYEYKLWHGQYKEGAKVTVYEHGLNNIVSEKITNSEGSILSGLDPSKTYDVAVNGIICEIDVSVPDIISITVGATQKGDLNSDGILNSTDAAIALEIAAGSRPCDAAMLAAADVSGDGRVTSLDALMILQAAAGSIEL